MPPAGLTGKVAIVTGVSRPKSIGAAVCRAFASCGAAIFFTHWLAYDRQLHYEADEERLAALEAEFRGYGVPIRSAEVDLGVPDAPKWVVDRTVAELGAPNILVNNAAHWSGGGLDKIEAAVL